MKSKILPLLIISIILIPSVLSIALTPAKTTINFESNKIYPVRLILFNNENINLTLNVFSEGALNDYIELEKEEISFTTLENSTPFRFTINLPNTLKKQPHTSKIFFRDPKLNQTISHTVIVNVEGPGMVLLDNTSNKGNLSLGIKIVDIKSYSTYIYLGLIILVILIIIIFLANKYELRHKKLEKARKFIKEATAEGHTLEEIKYAAIRAKWDEYIIAKLFNK